MATDIDTGDRVFTLGNVFGRAFDVMRGEAITVFGVSFLLGAIPQAIWAYALPLLVEGAPPANVGQIWILGMIGGLVMLGFGLVAQGALLRVSIAHGEGRSVSIGQSLNTGLVMLLPLLGLAIISWLGIMIGMVLLVVPGVILAIMWIVAAPALVAERGGIIASLSRSRFLTKGARWKIFGLMVLILIVVWLTLLLVALFALGSGAGTMMTGQSPTIVATVVGLAANTFITGFWATLLNALFVELRNWKDGFAPDNLADVFA